MFATDEPLPDNWLDQLQTALPGADLAQFLERVDVSALDESGQVAVLAAHARLVAHYQAQMHRDVAALEASLRGARDVPHHLAVENTAVEVGAALNLTRRTAEHDTHMALELVHRLPEVHAALLRGDIDLARAKVLVHGSDHLPDHTARRLVGRALEEAADMTTGQLRALLRRLCIEHDPEDAAKRYERSLEDRRVEVHANPEGTANLWGLDLPADRVAAIGRYLTDAAKKLRSVAGDRTMDQLRADVMLDILEGAHSPIGAPRSGHIHLTVALETLLGNDDKAAEIAGFGPITADLARQLAAEMADAEWTFAVTDPASGKVVCDGTTRRRPVRSQLRRLQARDPNCVWPGCRMPSVDCDIDHLVRHVDGGCAHDHNLAPICRFHHRMRHQAQWTYQRRDNGDVEWTSGIGRTYLVRRRSRAP